MLCVEDALDSLAWAESVGGLPGLIARSEANLAAIVQWVDASPWAQFLARDPATRSCTSICLSVASPWFQGLGGEAQAAAVKRMVTLLNEAGVALLAGTSFGEFGEGYIRLSFANSQENLKRALDRIEGFLADKV